MQRAPVGNLPENTGPFGIMAGLFPAATGLVPQRGTKEFLDGYATMPWLHAIVDKIAFAEASIEWKLYIRKGKNGQAVKDHQVRRAAPKDRRELIRKAVGREEMQELPAHIMLDMLDSGNSYMTGFAMRLVLFAHLELVGETFLLKERNGVGAVVGLWPIPPNWVVATPTPQRRTFRVSYLAWQQEIPDVEMLWIARPSMANPYGRGTGIVRALADELEIDEFSAKHMKMFYYNNAQPPFVVTADGLTPAETRRFEESWLTRLQGVLRQWRPMFLNRKVDIHEFQKDFRKLQFIQIREHERDVIQQSVGMPPELLGILSSSNRATITAAETLFAKWLLVPRMELVRSALQEKLIPEYDDRLILDYVSPVDEDQAHKLEVAKAASWALDQDEWRGLMGFDPLPDGRGRIFMVPFAVTPTHLDQLGEPVPEPSLQVGNGHSALRDMKTEELLKLMAETEELLPPQTQTG